MSLRDTYAYAISTAKGKFDGSAQEKDGKLYFAGSVKTEAEANEIWNAIKTIPEWQKEVVADIKVTGGGTTAAAGKTYTVKARPAGSRWSLDGSNGPRGPAITRGARGAAALRESSAPDPA